LSLKPTLPRLRPPAPRVRRTVCHNAEVPMRTDCRHYESRTYDSGEVVRKCRLDLAPEAPWRCPADCAGYELRRIDAGWQVGSLERGAEPPEPEPEGEDVAALLDEAEDIVNTAAPAIVAEIEAQEPKRRFGRKSKGNKNKNKKKRGR
jgi:hypothetical protein